MLPEITEIKGVPPGAVLRWELKKRGLESKQFALSLGEHPQTINAISRGRRGISPRLSIKLGEKLGVDAEYFMLLQAYYEVEKKKQELLFANQAKPNMEIISRVLFWDTDIDKIDWQKHKRDVIRRVFERGSDAEIKEIIAFYGEKTVEEALHSGPQCLPSLIENAKQYLGIDVDKKQCRTFIRTQYQAIS
jgi:addiction module HigA family antidote